MTTEKSKTPRRARWVRLLFLLPILAALWVPAYNRTEPTLVGIPFFYWYQLAWILLGAVIVLAVYAVDRKTAPEPGRPSGIDTTGAPGDIL